MQQACEFRAIKSIRKGEEVRITNDRPSANVQRKIQSADIHARCVARMGPAGHALPKPRQARRVMPWGMEVLGLAKRSAKSFAEGSITFRIPISHKASEPKHREEWWEVVHVPVISQAVVAKTLTRFQLAPNTAYEDFDDVGGLTRVNTNYSG